MLHIFGMLRAEHIHIDSLSVVGPLFDGLNSCNLAAEEIAQNLKDNLKIIKGLDPNIVIGEIEPIGSVTTYPAPRLLSTWLDLEQRSDIAIAYLHADIEWGSNWRRVLDETVPIVRSHGIIFGAIVNGNRSALSNAAFTEEARRQYELLSSGSTRIPEQVIFQSWFDYPRRILPELDHDTLAGLVVSYLRHKTEIRYRGDQAYASSEDGVAVTGKQLEILNNTDALGNSPEQTETITGHVPYGATGYRLAIRMHTECACSSAPADIEIDNVQMSYPDIKDRIASTTQILDHLSVHLGHAEPSLYSGPIYSTYAQGMFSLKWQWRVPFMARHTGVLGIIFTDRSGREIIRTTKYVSPTWMRSSEFYTDIRGRATIAPPSHEAIQVRLKGDARLRPYCLDVSSPLRGAARFVVQDTDPAECVG